LTGEELIAISHSQAPWIGTPQKEIIDYNLSFYRETNFNGI
jgi:uncharacterized phage-associated protein